MSREPPDFWVGDEGSEQLKRWYVIPKNKASNAYLHLFLKDDPVLHDHPFESTSIILDGCYREHWMDGTFSMRFAGDVVKRDATTPHRICLVDGRPCTSLFLTGPQVRDWGFIHPDAGWISAKEDPHFLGTRHWRA